MPSKKDIVEYSVCKHIGCAEKAYRRGYCKKHKIVSTHRCSYEGCSTIPQADKKYCYRHSNETCKDNIEGYIRLVDKPLPRSDPWAQSPTYNAYDD